MGHLSKILKELRIDDKEVWDMCVKYFVKERYRPTLEESINALEGLHYYKTCIMTPISNDKTISRLDSNTSVKQDTLDTILDKVESNIYLTIWNDNQKVFNRAVTGLVDLERFDNTKLYNRISEYLLGNLSMGYDSELVIDTCFKIFLAGHGNEQMLTML